MENTVIPFTAERFPSVAALAQIALYFTGDPGSQSILAAIGEQDGRAAQHPANFANNIAKHFTPDNRSSYHNLCEAYRDNYEGRWVVSNQLKGILKNL
jgi:hypothetical protein